jgi:hypothetical protein
MATSRLPRKGYVHRDTLDEARLRDVVQRALAGNTDLGPASAARDRTVVWDDSGDQALVHLDSVVVKLIANSFVVSVDLETEQTARAPLIVVLAFGTEQDPAGLVATTDALARGNAMLAARWGRVLQETIWAALIGIAQAHAEERGKVPFSLHVIKGHVRFTAAEPVVLGDEARATFDRVSSRRHQDTSR